VRTYRVIISEPAERDIEAAFCWLAERDQVAAIRWYNRLLGVIYSLDKFPERCPFAPENRDLAGVVRQVLHGRRQHKYRILFDIKDDEVRILHIRHGARLALGETESSGK